MTTLFEHSAPPSAPEPKAIAFSRGTATLRIEGDAYTGLHLLPGDLVYVADHQPRRPGQVVVIIHDDGIKLRMWDGKERAAGTVATVVRDFAQGDESCH